MQATVQVFAGWLEKIPTLTSQNRCEVGIGIFPRRKNGHPEMFLGRCVEFLSAVRLYREGRATGPPRPLQERRLLQENGEIMPQYLVAIHHPDDYDPSVEGEAMQRDIHALNREMIAAGVRIFVGGLSPARNANSLRAQPDGKVLITDGPYLETKEHIGGFWVLEVADLDEALGWGRKAAVACRAAVEVRPFFAVPAEHRAVR